VCTYQSFVYIMRNIFPAVLASCTQISFRHPVTPSIKCNKVVMFRKDRFFVLRVTVESANNYVNRNMLAYKKKLSVQRG